MTGVLALHVVAEGLRTLLDDAYGRDPRPPLPTAEFRLLSSGELATAPALDNVLSLFVYRVTHNEHLRNAARSAGPGLGESVPLSLDVHLLLTAWAGGALAEHALLAWAMRELHRRPVLDGAALGAGASWGADDRVQLAPAELPVEDMMRVWERLGATYRLSVGYVARAVRIDVDALPDGPPVVARRIVVGERPLLRPGAPGDAAP